MSSIFQLNRKGFSLLTTTSSSSQVRQWLQIKETASLVHNESIRFPLQSKLYFFLFTGMRPTAPKARSLQLASKLFFIIIFFFYSFICLFILESDETQASFQSRSTHALVANLVNQSEPCRLWLNVSMVNIYRGIKFPVNHDKMTLKNHERKKKPFFGKTLKLMLPHWHTDGFETATLCRKPPGEVL